MKNKIKYFVVVFGILALASCKNSKEKYSTIQADSTAVAPQTTLKSTTHKVVVNEFKNAENYTYLNVTEDGKAYWIAIPKTDVKVGNTYYYKDGMPMKNFESKQLKRTFDEIIFADGISDTENVLSAKDNPHTEVSNTYIVDKIEQPKNGTSIEELISHKDNYANKEIVVKGKVVKVNNGIMNKNWVHIADGTVFENKRDLGITTLDSVKMGDIVTFKGKLTLNKDFGYGYVYPILLEDAVIVK